MSFAQATRQLLRTVGNKQIPSGGGAVEIVLPKVGLLSRLHVEIEGTVTVTHSSATSVTVADFSPWKILDRIRLTANNGVDIYDVSGFGAYLENLTRRAGSIIDTSSTLDDVYSVANVASSSGTENNIRCCLEIPLTLNDRDLMGLFLMQNDQTNVTLRLDCNTPVTDGVIYKTLSGFTLAAGTFNIYVTAESFTIPSDPRDYPPLDMVMQTIESKRTYSTIGTNTFELPTGNILTKLINYYLADSVKSHSNVDSIELQYNQAETPYVLRTRLLRKLARDMYGKVLPAGVLPIDFNHQGVPQLGTARDWVNTAAITDVNINTKCSGSFTTLDHYIVRQQLVPLARG